MGSLMVSSVQVGVTMLPLSVSFFCPVFVRLFVEPKNVGVEDSESLLEVGVLIEGSI